MGKTEISRLTDRQHAIDAHVCDVVTALARLLVVRRDWLSSNNVIVVRAICFSKNLDTAQSYNIRLPYAVAHAECWLWTGVNGFTKNQTLALAFEAYADFNTDRKLEHIKTS